MPGYKFFRGVDVGPHNLGRARPGIVGSNLMEHFGYACDQLGPRCAGFSSDGWFKAAPVRSTPLWSQYSSQDVLAHGPCLGTYLKEDVAAALKGRTTRPGRAAGRAGRRKAEGGGAQRRRV